MTSKVMDERGFTLIELLTVLAIISLLTFMGFSAFRVYQANAAYAVVGDTMRKFITAFEAGVTDIDNPPGAVALTTQNTRGPIADPGGRNLLPAMMVPVNVSIAYDYDPACMDGGCQSAILQVNHCLGDRYQQWVRMGDGLGILLENIDGEGCP